MDGLEATRHIIAGHGSARPRIVALTADAMQDDRERCSAAGMDDYVTKPIRPANLVAALERSAPPEAVLGAEVLARLVETYGGDTEFIAVVVKSFSDEAPATLEQLPWAGLSRVRDHSSHSATRKSSAATFGATTLGMLCAELEAHAREGDLTDGQEALGQAPLCARRDRHVVAALLASSRGRSVIAWTISPASDLRGSETTPHPQPRRTKATRSTANSSVAVDARGFARA